jgi:penicillin-binding protein 1C
MIRTGSLALMLALAASIRATQDPAQAARLQPEASLRILDRYGNLLREFRPHGQASSYPVSLSQISPWMVLATLAAEDQRFWEHSGVDAQALARALGQDLRAGKVVSGASTLTQQLSKSLEPRPRTWMGKLKEAWQALRLEKEHSKSEILEAYLNRSYYGPSCQGVEAASRLYFGLPASQLSLAQASVLAGLPKSPKHLDPLRHRKAAMERQAWILGRLATEHWTDPESLALAASEKILLRPQHPNFEAPHFCDAVRRWSHGQGGDFHSSLDGPLQKDLEGLLHNQLQQLEEDRVTEAALLLLDNSSGQVLAWVGSADYFGPESGQVDGVLAHRQPGSALKPFLYALGFSKGYKPSDLVDDAPYTNLGGYSPRNYDRSYHGRVSLRQALACSYNIPAVKLIESLGVREAYANDRRFGLVSLDQGADYYGPGLALGDGEISLLELASAYAALARQGLWRPARLNLSGPPMEWPQMPRHRALDAGSCFQVLDVLRDNAAREPAFGMDSVLRLPFGAAVKTGTTKDYRDNWCVGVTPEWTLAVWAGNYDGQPMRRVSGVSGAGPLFHDAAMRISQSYPPSEFRAPQEVQEVDLCLESGRWAGPSCGASVTDWIQRRYQDRLSLPGIALLDPMGSPESGPRIEFPRPGQVFVLDPQASAAEQSFKPRASGLASGQKGGWSLDGRPMDADPWVPLLPGRHVLALQNDATDPSSPREEVHFSVLE